MKTWPLKRTIAATMTVRALLDTYPERTYARQISQATGLPSGTLSPILKRLEEAGWITAHPEEDAPRGRPPRRYLRLTTDGILQGPDYVEGRETR